MSGAFSATKISPSVFLSTALGLAIAWITLPTKSVQAQPIVPTPNGTGTEVILNNNQWDIYGGSLSSDQINLFHQFQQFGLTEGQIANFLANPNLRNIISTVDGGNPSLINGLLQVTGGNPNLFLMNPSGIIFGPNAQLNVPASFSAITADGIQFGDRWLNAVGPNDYSALTGDPTAFRFSSDFTGAIVNAGNLQVNPGAALALMGGTVINTGQLTAPQGQILITAVPGESLVRLALPGYILNLEVEVPLTEGDTPQTWQLPITALPTLLTQGLTPELLGLAINSAGEVQLADGTPIPNAPGTAMVSGGVDVSGNQGGTAAVLGDRIGLGGAQIDASGTQGDGGQILVGGEFQGNGPLPNAERTYVDANTTLNADAGSIGNGGRIIVWADEATGVYGDITARGGQLSGDGGFAEVSGRDYLQFDGTADLSSVNGEIGTLLLDPTTITISNAVGTTPGVPSTFPNILLSNFSGQDITINQTVLENAASTSRIILQAEQGIIIGDLNAVLRNPNDPSSSIPTLTLSNGATLLVANGLIEILNQNARILVHNGDLDIQSPIIASGNIDIQSPIITNGGDLNITAGSIATGEIVTNNPFGDAGEVNLTATQGDITTNIRAIVRNTNPTIEGDGGNITLIALNGDITVNNNLVSFSANGDGGDIYVEAGGNITIVCGQSADYCVESFGGGIPNVPPRGDSGDIRFISREGSILIENPPAAIPGNTAINAGNSIFNAGSITVEAAGDIRIGGGIFAHDVQLNSSVLGLTSEFKINSDLGSQSVPGNVNISGRVNGSEMIDQQGRITVANPGLTIDSDRGTINLGDSIGSTIPIGNLTISGQQATVSGNIRTANSPIIFNSPVTLSSNSLLTFDSGTATITLNGLNAGSTPLTLIADDFNFSGTLQGSSTLTIQPSTLSRGIILGSTVTSNLSPAEIATLQGFSNVTIGGGSGDITVNAPVTLNTPTQLITTGNITDTGGITSNSGNIALNGNTINTNTINTANGGINVTATGAVIANTITTNGGGIAISGNTVIANTLTTTGGLSVSTDGDIAVTNATATGGGVDLRGRSGSIQANTLSATGGSVVVNGAGSITTTTASAIGGNVALTSSTGTVQANDLSATGGGIDVTAPGGIVVPNATADGIVALRSGGGTVQTSNVVTNGGAVTLSAQTNLGVDNVTTNGGSINLRSTTDTITVNNIYSASGTAAGGAITITNPNTINASAINASGATTGGAITLRGGSTPTESTPTGTVTTGNLTSTGTASGGNITALARDTITTGAIDTSGATASGNITLSGGNTATGTVTTGNLTSTGTTSGGDITVLARDTITTGEINTSATVGNGGNVLLDPLGDVQVTFINAQGGTNGAGGNVEIRSIDRFFRATGAFPDRNGILASISAAGGGGEGTITITHNGGAANVLVPFIISTASDNGTVGALTTGANNIIFPGSFLGPYTQGNIDIITSPQATQLADASLPDTRPEEIQPAETDNQPFWLDEYFTRRTEDYLGINGETRVKSLEEIQGDLRRVEESTNIRPALIYVLFEPRESLITIPETGLFNPDKLINRGALSRFEPLPSDRLQMILVTAYGEPILYRPPENTDEIDANDITRENAPREVFDFESAVLEDLRNYEERRVTDESLYLHHAQVLYQWLVAPLEQDLESQGIQNLVFIMDDGLRTTPLAVLSAMHNGRQFIIENYSVGLMPSFSLTSSRHINLRSSRILAMGMSDFSQYEELDNLEAVDEEVRLINQSLWGGSDSNIDRFLGSNFTPENLILQRRDQSSNIVHLATHAKVEIGAPENSFLVFYDGKLFFDQLDRLRLDSPPIELLVLSACQAALSPDDESAELGFAGLSVQAGVNTVLASFWEVPDFPTLGLMTEFYNQLQTSPIRSEALRQAQLAMINREVFFQNDRLFWSSNSEAIPALRGVTDTLWLSHPGYWSSFTMIGNPW
ncbi:MAG: CHAT domain-containing protein [Spirulina sp.]